MTQNSILSGVQVAQEMYSIYWLSLQQPATGVLGGWQGPVISPYYAPALWPPNTSIDRRVPRGTAEGVVLAGAAEPWALGEVITIVGVQAQMLSANPQAQLGMILGQATGLGPDVFFHMAGIGCVEKTLWLPTDGRIQFNADSNPPVNNAHFDVYTATSDPYTILMSIYYLAGPPPT